MRNRIAILMPAYNERERLAATLSALRDEASERAELTVFLVDDGSEPPVDAQSLPKPTDHFHVVVARHATNLGQGATLETARQLALRESEIDAFVTMDADGQHAAADALALARAIVDGADVAFGNRFGGSTNVPPVRALLLRVAIWFEFAISGLRLADAHNGLRAFSRTALEHLPIRQSRMAHATEIHQRVSRDPKLVVVEVPVSVRYTRESIAKGQRSLGAFAILHDLAVHYLFGEQGR
jgi:glycosyltransferase involved in cell wall biosynthesis